MTPFMLRVAALVGGDLEDERESIDIGFERASGGGPAVRDSLPKPVPIGADEQVVLRALAEQLVSEANAILHDRNERIDLDDQLVDGQLGFSMTYGARAAVVRTRFDHHTAVGELIGVGARPQSHVELAGPDELAELILLLLAQPAAV